MLTQRFTAVTESSTAPMALIGVYFFCVILTIVNYVAYFRFNEPLYGADFLRAYLAFTILGGIVYTFVSAVAWLWAAKYVSDNSDRVVKTAIGVMAMFLFHDLPCFIMEWHAILCCGWRNGFQGFVFIVQILSFTFSFVFAWLSYCYLVAGWVNSSFGDGWSSAGLKTGAAAVSILPAAPAPQRQSQPQPQRFPEQRVSLHRPLLAGDDDERMSPLLRVPVVQTRQSSVEVVPMRQSSVDAVRWSQPQREYSPRDDEMQQQQPRQQPRGYAPREYAPLR
jgi:hypothetical protein